MIKKFLYLFSGFILLSVVTVSTWFFFMGSHTRYCPLSHFISDTTVCIVLDELDDKILVQHGDLDTNWYYLEVRENDKSENFKFPDFIHVVGKNDYSAKLIKGDNNHILINDKVFKLEKYNHT